jgi:hypothetical protein
VGTGALGAGALGAGALGVPPVEPDEAVEEAPELEVEELPDEASLSEHPETITAAASAARKGNLIIIDSAACRTILSSRVEC